MNPKEQEPRELLVGSTDLQREQPLTNNSGEHEDNSREQSRRSSPQPTTTNQTKGGGRRMGLDSKAIPLPVVMMETSIRSYLIFNNANNHVKIPTNPQGRDN